MCACEKVKRLGTNACHFLYRAYRLYTFLYYYLACNKRKSNIYSTAAASESYRKRSNLSQVETF